MKSSVDDGSTVTTWNHITIAPFTQQGMNVRVCHLQFDRISLSTESIEFDALTRFSFFLFCLVIRMKW